MPAQRSSAQSMCEERFTGAAVGRWRRLVMAKMVARALVGSRLDYANSVLFGATQKKTIQTPESTEPPRRVVTRSPQSCSPRTLLQQLHWLPVKHRIDF